VYHLHDELHQARGLLMVTCRTGAGEAGADYKSKRSTASSENEDTLLSFFMMVLTRPLTMSSAAARTPDNASLMMAVPPLMGCLAWSYTLLPSLRRLDLHLASSAPHHRSTASHSANNATARRVAASLWLPPSR
jgi:hypothetical protein